MHFNKQLFRRGTILMALFLLAGCAGNTTPIAATNPLYVLVAVKQQLQLDVIARPSQTLAGTIAIQQIGQYAPTGGLGVSRAGTVIVTYTGAEVNGNLVVTPATKSCSLHTGACTTLTAGWGSSMVSTVGQQVVVPLWNDAAHLKGQIAYLSPDTLSIAKRVAIKSIIPGANVVTPDNRTMYWLSYVAHGNGGSYELLRYDILRQQITATHTFGKEIPASLAIAPDGSISTPILYASQGNKLAQTTTRQPGSWVERFSSALTPLGKFAVGPYPQQIAINTAGTIAISYGQSGPQRIDIFQAGTGKPMHQYALPATASAVALSTLRDGHFAAISTVGNAQFSLCEFGPTTAHLSWHSYPGSAISSVTG